MANYSISSVGESIILPNLYVRNNSTNSYYIHAIVKLVSQDQASRTSTLQINYYWGHYSGDSTSTWTKSGLTINGINIPSSAGGSGSSGNVSINGRLYLYYHYEGGPQPFNIGTISVTLPHDVDGSFSLKSVNFRGGYGRSYDIITYGTEANHTLSLPTIPVSSGFSVSPEASLTVGGSTISYTIDPGSPDWTHKIGISTSETAAPSLILSTVPANTTTGEILIPDDVADIMTNQTQTLYITCQPFKESTGLGYSRVARVFRIPNTPEFLPTMTVTLSAVDSSGAPIDYGYVVGLSNIRVSADELSLKHNATLSYISSTIDTIEYYLQPVDDGYEVISDDTLKVSGIVTITSKIVDSRGMTNIYTDQISVLPYRTPEIVSLAGYRSDANGRVDAEGQYLHIELYYTISSILVNSIEYNGYKYKLEYKKTTELNYSTVTGEDTTPTGTDTYTYDPMSVSRSVNVFVGNISANYNIRFTLYDRLSDLRGQDIETYVIRAAGNVFFNFNNRGTGVGIGKLSEIDGLDIGWKTRFDQGIVYASIPANLSIDSIRSPGFYEGSSANNNTGGPTGITGGFGLIVKSTYNNLVSQEFCSDNGGVYHRVYDGTSWGNWNTYMSADASIPGSTDFVNTVYPVGSVYISVIDTNPSTLFPNTTWTRIGAGKFLVAAGDSGTYAGKGSDPSVTDKTGGSDIYDLPAHKHLSPIGTRGWTNVAVKDIGGTESNQLYPSGNKPAWGASNATGSFNDVLEYYTGLGGSATIDTVPPWIAAYMWYRTA